MALALGTGAAISHLNLHPLWLAPPLLAFLVPNGPSCRPVLKLVPLLLSLAAGYILVVSGRLEMNRDCRLHIPEGRSLEIDGLFVGPLVDGRGEVLPTRLHGSGCLERFRVIVPDRLLDLRVPAGRGRAGERVTLRGRWRRTPVLGPTSPIRAGYLLADSLSLAGSSVGTHAPARLGSHLRRRLVEGGGWVQRRLEDLFPRGAPLATALVWARKDRLSPEVREAFARAGTAHLL
ncbi:MAG: hypothetical protein KJN92_11535, partial [Gemmatimonadetes bacterium]|nr:hypothetical protein [Gemmatimonadota bacterium]